MIGDCSDFVKFIRKYLKTKIINSTDGFQNHESEHLEVYNLLKRTVEKGESNSLLIIGPPGSGKTTFIKDLLTSLEDDIGLKSNAILIQLNGLIHTDDNLALKSSAAQMMVKESTEGKLCGTFAENLSFLLKCLQSGQRETSKSLIFILEEFDMFCSHSNQTLLYNLFDMTHNAPIPICVIGLTCRVDVTELFEKRVKSRFSHRQIFLFPGHSKDNKSSFELRTQRVKQLLTYTDNLTKEDSKKFGSDVKQWNKDIENLVKDKKFLDTMQQMYDITVDERDLKNLLIRVISKLEDREDIEEGFVIKSNLTVKDFVEEYNNMNTDGKICIIEDLSVLEICLLIAIRHHSQIYDDNPFNFEMILTRYNKFTNANSLTNSVSRPVAMKAFEHIKVLELIAPVGSTAAHLQKEYQLYKMLFLPKQLDEALKNYIGLPTEIQQWATSSLA